MGTTLEQMRANVGKLLRGIDRYNPENLSTLERYVDTQARENTYDLEANLATDTHTHTYTHTPDDVNLTTDTQVKVWMNKYGWTENEDVQIFIHSQEESVKPKNIVEKIDFESVSSIMATSQ
ncbi:eukaryotic translation initiation factor 3 subunit K-like isoform X2 [Carassius gibelio]|uniref:eukaryotic translation initiation factor 3 subunit K-like isoform X2 n=1 Tax=Carassius gibelio TaxID=101364 RepID=UPI00227767A6|nr:eukaryotic translation initiation factor 3 subunit K-like isoform X2 [Carassius gibelio]